MLAWERSAFATVVCGALAFRAAVNAGLPIVASLAVILSMGGAANAFVQSRRAVRGPVTIAARRNPIVVLAGGTGILTAVAFLTALSALVRQA